MKTFEIADILQRLKQALDINTDIELANRLGIGKTTLSNWKTRNTFDAEAIFAICEHINLNWLIFGRGANTSSELVKEDIEPSMLLDKVIEQAKEISNLENKIEQLEAEVNTVRQELTETRLKNAITPPNTPKVVPVVP